MNRDAQPSPGDRTEGRRSKGLMHGTKWISTIMSWLRSLINPEINDTCMFLSMAKEIWDVI